jgi:probable rRNA maturation factor
LSIRIFYDEINFRVKSWKRIKKIIEKVIVGENKTSGDLNFIVTNDENLRKINIRFLEHDYNTDVITFNYNSGDLINGEVYVSIETIRYNADNYNVSLEDEVFRVLIHGVLHLLGYDDKTSEQRKEMREGEDKWLNLYKDNSDGF